MIKAVERVEGVEGRGYRWGMVIVAVALLAAGVEAGLRKSEDFLRPGQLANHKKTRSIVSMASVNEVTQTMSAEMPTALDPVKGLNPVAIARAQGKSVWVMPETVIHNGSFVEQSAVTENKVSIGGESDGLRDIFSYQEERRTVLPNIPTQEQEARLTDGLKQWVGKLRETVFPGTAVGVDVLVTLRAEGGGGLFPYEVWYKGVDLSGRVKLLAPVSIPPQMRLLGSELLQRGLPHTSFTGGHSRGPFYP